MAGTVTQTFEEWNTVKKWIVDWVADAADGTVPATASSKAICGRLHSICTNPGATAPTANYDITCPGADRPDVLQGVGANRHTSNTEEAPVIYTSTSDHPVINDVITFTLANNAVNSALGRFILYYSAL